MNLTETELKTKAKTLLGKPKENEDEQAAKALNECLQHRNLVMSMSAQASLCVLSLKFFLSLDVCI